jgi:hypothetical protein
MPLSSVQFNVAGGGIGRRAPNEDKISGMVTWNATTPAGFATVITQKVFTLDEAIALGIVNATGTEIEYYFVSEYFRANPVGELWIQWNGSNIDPDFTELPLFQTAAQGELRQIGVLGTAGFLAAQVTTLQAQIDLFPSDAPASVLYTANFSALTVSALTDLRILTAKNVSVVLAQDGGAAGAALAVSLGQSICNVGAALGTVSSAGVQESIGHLARFDKLSNGVEMEVLAYGTGELVQDTSATQQGALKDDGYLIARKYLPNVAGSYWERCPTCVVATDDFAWIEIQRTIDKAIRGVGSALTPQLQGGVRLNDDGTLSDDSIGFFQDLALNPLTAMQSNGEISGRLVEIDPNQDILATSTLEVTIKILPIAIAEFITVTIGLSTEL